MGEVMTEAGAAFAATLDDRVSAIQTNLVQEHERIAGSMDERGAAIQASLVQGHDLEEVASTRLLVHTAQLIGDGLSVSRACRAALVETLSDDPSIREGLLETIQAYFPDAG